MQYCQTCNRAYADDSLSYCLDDGSPLSAGSDPKATLVRPESLVKPPIDHHFIPSWRSSHHWIFYPALFLLALLVGASSGTLLYKFQKSNPSSASHSNIRTPISVTQAPSPVRNESSFPGVPQATSRDDPESLATHNLAGTWSVLNTVEKTSYQSFANLRIGYRLIVSQKGANFTAEGEKVLENGRTLPTGGRTAIHLSGAVEGETISASFVEEGARRKTNGRFLWRLEPEGNQMKGTFVSTAANSSGTSVATKER